MASISEKYCDDASNYIASAIESYKDINNNIGLHNNNPRIDEIKKLIDVEINHLNMLKNKITGLRSNIDISISKQEKRINAEKEAEEQARRRALQTETQEQSGDKRLMTGSNKNKSNSFSLY